MCYPVDNPSSGCSDPGVLVATDRVLRLRIADEADQRKLVLLTLFHLSDL